MNAWIESSFTTFDGLALFYRYRKPVHDTRETLLYLHRGHEHSGRIVPFADKLAGDDYWCFAFDLRGHGRSEGERAWASCFDDWVRDLNSFVQHLRSEHGIDRKELLLVSNSVGSVMAITWLLNYGAVIRGCILGAPAFSIRLYVPLALPAMRLVSRFSSNLFVTSYVKSKMLTRDPDEATAYDADPLITKKIGVNVLVTLFDAAANIFRRLADIETPLLLFTAERDVIVKNRYHGRFLDGVSSRFKKHVVLSGFQHAIFHEIEQEKILRHSRKFVEAQFRPDHSNLLAVIPEARSHTVIEYMTLSNEPQGVKISFYAVYRWLFERVGRSSCGIAIGLEHGFDSGMSLDYVYRNHSQGDHVIGRLLDRIYLNSPGWRGIRTRKEHLKSALKRVLTSLHRQGIEPVVFDIAAGAGRYLFEAQAEVGFPVKLYMNDLDSGSIRQARENALDFYAESVFISSKNVFNAGQAWQFQHAPNIVVISGLFELYENNNAVQAVIIRVFEMLERGGHLIYTGQPWHPQLETIARLLNNRNGERWVMRRRIQNEMDQLVEYAGFSKLGTLSDKEGIFTVSHAVKPSLRH